MPSSFSEKLLSRGVTSTLLTAPHQPNPAPTPEPNLSGLVEGQRGSWMFCTTWNPSCCLYPPSQSLLILIHFWQASLKKEFPESFPSVGTADRSLDVPIPAGQQHKPKHSHKATQPMSLVMDFNKTKQEHAHHLPRLLRLKGKQGPTAKVSGYL